MLRHFLAQECHARLELLDAIHAVFDADPTGEVDAFELGENGIVVVEALADLAVAEALGVADGVGFFAAQIFNCSGGEVAVGGVQQSAA